MPQVIITEKAAQGLERCRLFLMAQNPQASRRAALAISKQFQILGNNPTIGRQLEDYADWRELIIPFGNSGYLALYRHDVLNDKVYILTFRHQKQAGY